MIKTLRPLKENIKEKNIISFDIETEIIDNKNIFLLGTTYSNEEQKIFHDRYDMIDYLMIYRENTYIAASNLEFDFNILFYDTEYYYKFKPICSGSIMIAMIYNTWDRHKIYFIDSYNYYHASVENYGKIINVPKLEKPKNLGSRPKTLEEWKYLERYCMRDSEITYKIIKFLESGFNAQGTKIKITVASTAMNLYRKKYLNFNIRSEEQKFMHLNKKLFAGYYGGRTEIFKRGYIKNLNYLDYNSMYPSVMMGEYPNPNTMKYANYPSFDIIEYEGVSQVMMICPEMNIPLLPVYDHKLIFPTGQIRGVYTHAEIRKALEMGYRLKQIIWSVYYTKNYYPFKEYITDMYNKRRELKEQGSSLEIVYKLMMNSLYGKFAQKTADEIELIDMTQETLKDKCKDAKITMSENNTGYAIKKKLCESSFVRPIYSIYTTAYARIKITQDMIKYDGYYCDTDSIMTRKEISDSKILGELKKELFIKRGILVRPKMYKILTSKDDDIIRLKGVPKADIKTFDKILDGNNVEYDKFTKMKESLKKGINPMTKIKMIKNINLEDDKRVWNQRFDPYILDEYSRPYEIMR